jgi:hypothetical protein
VKWDLEQIPWPWQDDSVAEVVLHHVLEHLGQTPGTFFGIIRELYRVCRDGASVDITVPHPRHDEFLSDPTHVRAFTPESFALYSKDLNRLWQEKGCANSALGLYLDVDFIIASLQLDLDPPWLARLRSGEMTEQQISQVREIEVDVGKSGALTPVAVMEPVLIAGTLFYIGFTGLEPILPSLVSKVAPESAYGTALGSYNTLQFLGSFVGGSVAGALSHFPPDHILTVLLAAGAFGFLLMIAAEPKRL